MADAPVLKGVQIDLRPFTSNELTETYVGWLRDPEVTRYSEQRHRTHSLASCAAYVGSFHSSPHYLWAIWEREKGAHIGNIAATLDPTNDIADISILIGERSVQGRGIGSEAWSLVLAFLLNDLHVRKVTGGCMAANRAMVRLMQSAGMVPDGKRVGHYLLDGIPTDIVYFARFATT